MQNPFKRQLSADILPDSGNNDSENNILNKQ